MADKQPNPTLRKMYLEVRLMEHTLSVKRMEVEKVEIEEKKLRIEENLQATLKAIEDVKKELAS